MLKKILIPVLILCLSVTVHAQKYSDSIQIKNLGEVVITANRIPFTLKSNPGAITVVLSQNLNNIPKGIGAEEALKLVPGVRIDNQHDGERVHLSIRGQGILTERGLRGIGVIIDGIPVNDPSGFAPDLYDVDWNSVKKIEVLRGPAAGLYGGSAAAGVINVTTQNGGDKLIGGELNETYGSNGFLKSYLTLGGTSKDVNYRVGYSRTDGDGYRDHQAFWANKLYEKVIFTPTTKFSLTQIISHTDYFQQNPEGLNLGQFDNLKQANPDACPFNEYQKTNRTTVGLSGNYKFAKNQEISLSTFLRNWNYKETSNRCAEYRTYVVPGLSAQYHVSATTGSVKHDFSLGTDIKTQRINMYKLQSGSDPNRKESTDETNIENKVLLANQIISQSSEGVFAMYNLTTGKLSILGSIRYDAIQNELTDKMLGGDTAITDENFSNLSARLGLSYRLADYLTFFGNFSQGFMPPSTEELAANPVGYSGFNTHLKAATSNCFEIGGRGFAGEKVYYEVTGFYMTTENDFFRFKQSGRGNQEVFYGNAGNSTRIGIEANISYKILDNLILDAAYTFADFKYTSAEIDPVYTDTSYVLTTPPADGQCLPNSPKQQLYAEVNYKFLKNFTLTLGTEFQSKWAIYTDAKAYAGELDPAVYQNWQDGFNLYHARLAYNWHIKGLNGELSVYGRNITGQKYMAFTEPDPDGNSYQPGPGSEIFGGLKVKF